MIRVILDCFLVCIHIYYNFLKKITLEILKTSKMDKKMKNISHTQIVLGKGEYSSVFLAHDEEGNNYALKIFKKTSFTPEEERQYRNTINEGNILMNSNICHPNIIKCYTMNKTDNQVELLLEYVDTCFYQWICKQRFLSNCRARVFMKQLAEAIRYLHSKGICHRDIKLENIRITQNTNAIKLVDFGFATFTNDFIFTDHPGTVYYASPELIQGKIYLGMPAEIWALGVVYYIMLIGNFPFYVYTDTSTPVKIHIAKMREVIVKDSPSFQSTLVKDIDPSLKTLLLRFLDKNYRTRITLNQVCNEFRNEPSNKT